MAVAYRQNGGVESSGGGGGGSTVASSTQVTISQLLDSSGGSVQAADSANNAIRVNVVAGAAAGSTLVTVRQSTAADLQVTATPAAGSTFRTQPGSTLWASSAGFHFDSSGALQVAAAVTTSTTVNVSSLAGAVMVRSSAADHLTTVYQSSAADLQVTATPVTGSTWRTQPGSTLWASSAGFHFDSSGALQVTGGGGAGSTDVSVTQLRDSSGGSISAGDSANQAIRVNVVAGAAGGSTLVTVRQSSATDLQATVTPNEGSTWLVEIVGSTAWASSAGFHFDSSGALNVSLSGQSRVSQGIGNSSAADRWSVITAPASTAWASSAGFHFDSSGALQITGTFSASTTVNISSLAGVVETRELPASTVSYGQVVLGSTAVQIVAASTARTRLVIVQHSSSIPVFLGASTVTSTSGVLLHAIPGNQFLVKHANAVYGISTGGSPVVSFMQETRG